MRDESLHAGAAEVESPPRPPGAPRSGSAQVPGTCPYFGDPQGTHEQLERAPQKAAVKQSGISPHIVGTWACHLTSLSLSERGSEADEKMRV